MTRGKKIITIGLCPCWDTVCRVKGVDWGEHKQVSSVETYPAGKALNISRVLSYLGITNTAAGLWGSEDFPQAKTKLAESGRHIQQKFTVSDGKTRENITIIDEQNKREMHLRAPSELATRRSLRQLDKDLQKIVTANSICVFAGSMPGVELLDDVLSIIRHCQRRGAQVAVDTSGPVYRKIVAQGNLFLIKPNVEELRELTGKKIKDTTKDLVKAARKLLDKTQIVLVSRGPKGAIVVSKDVVFEACCSEKRTAVTTVACGDHLSAGFLAGLNETSDIKLALETAIKAATARAWGWTGEDWNKVKAKIKVDGKTY